MPRAHRRNLLLFAGLMIAGTGAPAASAQEGPMAAAPLPAPTLPGPAAEAGAAPVPAGRPAGLGTQVRRCPRAGTCTCGNRHGLSRWRWHRTQCKRHLQEHFLGYAEEFNEWPLGEALYAHARTQAANGLAARMVFYHYDFVDGTSQLNVRGRDKLAAVAATLPTTSSRSWSSGRPRTRPRCSRSEVGRSWPNWAGSTSPSPPSGSSSARASPMA